MTEVVGISLIKDEMDIFPHVINHLVGEGVQKFVLMDNNSTDGTWQYIVDLCVEKKWIRSSSLTRQGSGIFPVATDE